MSAVVDILLTTLNARYIHTAFGLRYLHANLGPLASRAAILEFDINDRALDIAETILSHSPRIVGFGVYIWNVRETLPIITALKKLRPELAIVLGGPEVSYEWDTQPIVDLADYLITGEADQKFRELCQCLLTEDRPAQKVLHAGFPDVTPLQLPYQLYNDRDLAQRVVYVEASRGCPFTCEFCLSSLDVPVRQFDTEIFLSEMQKLLDRGLLQFKFVDRTFNLNIRTSTRILQFFLDRLRPGLFVHFEMVPDRLPPALRSLIAQFPPGTLQFEVGIQTFNPEVAALINRKQNYQALEDNLRFLRQETGVHIHADLIAGLPGEDLSSFARGFDRLVHLAPQEIQVGILKRLRGAPIARHTESSGMLYSDQAPYEVLQTAAVPFADMQRLRRFAKTWDMLGNSGNFCSTTPLLWEPDGSPFEAVLQFSEWMFAKTKASSGHALKRLATMLYEYLSARPAADASRILSALSDDFFRLGRTDKPQFLADFEKRAGLHHERFVPQNARLAPERQSRHLAVARSE